MNTDHKRQVPIINAKTGEVRLSEPVPVRAPRATDEMSAQPASVTSAAPMPSTDLASTVSESTSGTGLLDAVTQPSTTAPATSRGEAETSEPDAKGSGPAKVKPDIETLEQFIAHVYARKGQRVALKPKVTRIIAGSPRLDEAAAARLMVLADADVLLSVPRQLLLLSREVEGFPALRGALASFVKEVMLRHAAFATPDVQDAVCNLPEGPSMGDAMATLARFEPKNIEGKRELKPADLQVLRRNSVNLLATWFACNRGVNLEELASLLLHALWAPAARELADDNARLRALTEVEQSAGVGLVCQRFRQRASEAHAAQEVAERDTGTLRSQVSQLEEQLEQATLALDARIAELAALRASTADELAQQGQAQEAERMHLRHELERLRGRLVRRLDNSIEMLEVGLTALRNKTPRIEVMLERAEHVVDALRAEKSNLKGE
ncbi:hypothetical protein [Caballeronia sp. INDeC2]|uniref:hypothetical protein n=1 Tax=Caballeronia sp. INDeC2 TaxID=2921747 RepID=UPI0020282240|nr:hypothetical protein [Caballeronia sp. INDeC2]